MSNVLCAAGAARLWGRTPGETDYGLGIKVDSARDEVWATVNSEGAAALRCYDLETGKLKRNASIRGKHVFNDLVVATNGTIYVSDTADNALYQLPAGMATLQRLAPQHIFTVANGIALSDDDRVLYIAASEDGIDAINLQSGEVTPMLHPDGICIAFIDGLSVIQGGLIAIQNGPMLPRIVNFRLSENGTEIVGMRVLERRNPAFDGITSGVVVRNELYYVANPQTDKSGGAQVKPLHVWCVRVQSGARLSQ